MIINLSDKSRSISEVIDVVGPPFKFWQSKFYSQNRRCAFNLISSNDEIINQTKASESGVLAELRPNGVLLWFEVVGNQFVLAMPSHLLSIYKSDNHIGLHAGSWRVKLGPPENETLNKGFLTELLELTKKVRSQDPWEL